MNVLTSLSSLSGLLVGLISAYFSSHLLHSLQSKGQSTFHCTHCDTTLGALGRIPVLGYILALGRCPNCTRSLPVLLWANEVFIFIFSVWSFQVLPPAKALQLSILATATSVITIADIKYWVIPNKIVVCILALTPIALLTGTLSMNNALFGLGVGLATAFMLWFPQVVDKERDEYAYGDIKLVLALSMWLGWVISIYAFFLASFFAFGVWMVLGMIKGLSIKRKLQFGPFVAIWSLIFGTGLMLDPQFVPHLVSFRF